MATAHSGAHARDRRLACCRRLLSPPHMPRASRCTRRLLLPRASFAPADYRSLGHHVPETAASRAAATRCRRLQSRRRPPAPACCRSLGHSPAETAASFAAASSRPLRECRRRPIAPASHLSLGRSLPARHPRRLALIRRLACCRLVLPQAHPLTARMPTRALFSPVPSPEPARNLINIMPPHARSSPRTHRQLQEVHATPIVSGVAAGKSPIQCLSRMNPSWHLRWA